MKTKSAILSFVILVISMLACSFATTTAKSSDPVVNSLYSNGFERDKELDGICTENDCAGYINVESAIAVFLYPDKVLVMHVAIGGEVDSSDSARAMSGLLSDLYPESVQDWILDHMMDSYDEDQYGSVDGYLISEELDYYGDQGGLLSIVIIPPLNP